MTEKVTAPVQDYDLTAPEINYSMTAQVQDYDLTAPDRNE